METPEGFDNPYERMVLDRDACFLCGEDTGDETEEHVFPKWLQGRHDLWNQRLQLLNQTLIPYRQLTIPCCTRCNGTYLSDIESKIRNATLEGYDACAALDPILIYQWMGKIFYGILRKELTLLYDRRNPEEGVIVPKEMIEGYNTLHAFLQSARTPFVFSGGPPFTVFVANIHDLGEGRNYFFRDSTFLLTASLRTLGVGFIVAFEDGGFNRDTYGRYIDEVAGRKLHPVQFDELYAKVIFQVNRLTSPNRFVVSTPKDAAGPTTVFTFPSAAPVTPWSQADFHECLVEVLDNWIKRWGMNPDDMFIPPNRVSSWMADDENNLQLLDADANPITSSPQGSA